MHEVLVNRLGRLSLPRKSVVRLIDIHMTLDVYRGRKTTNQQKQQQFIIMSFQTNDIMISQNRFSRTRN